MSWLGPHREDTALRYLSYDGSGWSPPITVATGADWRTVSDEDLIIAWTEVSDQTQVRTATIPIADLL